MRVDRFDFSLPAELIAECPVSPRDSAKLLYIGDKFRDFVVSDFPALLRAGDVLVFNDTKVIPARLKGKRNDANVEITLHKKDSDLWLAFAKPAKKLKSQDKIIFSEEFSADFISKGEMGEVTLKFNCSGKTFDEMLMKYGEPPLPPYILGKRKLSAEDKKNYQTIYARNPGAVAAPTAGLHFTEELFNEIAAKGIKKVFVTLHVGAGTFLPVKVLDTKDHKMHSEWFSISKETAAEINHAKKSGGRIIAIGTTSLRVLESAADENGIIKESAGETDIFITPGYKFKIVDLLFTNFHLPRSTLFMLVCAFAGEKKMHDAYKHAIDKEYRFYSYGDASLLERNDI